MQLNMRRPPSDRPLPPSRRGNALLMLLPFVIYLVIFAYALIRRTSAEHTQTFITHRRNVALYLAEGVLACADNYVRKEIDASMKEDFIENHVKSFNLYAEAKTVKQQVDDLLKDTPGATLEKLILDFVDVGKFPGGDSDDPNDKKECYGTLIFSAEIKYVDTVCRLDQTRDVKIVNITPPGNDYTYYVASDAANPSDVNKGAIVELNNKDKESGKTGKIRMEGHYVIDVGTADFLILPNGGKSLLPPTQGMLVPAKASPVMLTDPGYAFWGAQISNTQPGSTSAKTRSKLRLFGFYAKTQPGKVVPTKIEGKVEKHYRKIPYVYNATASAAASAQGTPVFIYNIDPSKFQDIVEDFKTVDGSGPVSHLGTPASGTTAKPADAYKARATTFTPTLQLGLFTLNNLTYIQGIHCCDKAEIGHPANPIRYAGKSLIVADNEMQLLNDFTVDPAFKKASSMGLIHVPTKVVDKPFEFMKSKAKMEASLYSKNGIAYAGPPPNFWRPLNIYGTYMCVKPNLNALKGTINVFYRDRIGDEKYAGLVAQVSPILSSYKISFEKGKE